MPDGLKNPFGPVVGEIMSMFNCSINGCCGLWRVYISTQAILLRKLSLGFELDSDIIPWRAVKSLSQNMDCILVETFDQKTYKLRVMDDLNGKMEALICAHEKSESMSFDHEGIKAANYLCNRLPSLLTLESDDSFQKPDHYDDNTVVEKNDMHKSLMGLQEEDDTGLSEVACMNLQIDCDVNEFFSLFLSDDAPHSLGHYHERVGDTNVKTTVWHNKKRKIVYSHPISLPGAPPTGEATKFQTIRTFGDHGLCIDTETRITNIPFADCFYVSDRLIITRNGCNKTLLTIKFGLTFEKRTLFRSVISATSIRDVKEFQKGFIATIQRALENNSSSDESSTNQNTGNGSKVSKKLDSAPENAKLPFSWFVILGLIFSNIYGFNQLQTVHNRLNLLEEMMNLRLDTKGDSHSDEFSIE